MGSCLKMFSVRGKGVFVDALCNTDKVKAYEGGEDMQAVSVGWSVCSTSTFQIIRVQ